jgi:hypothetical protein
MSRYLQGCVLLAGKLGGPSTVLRSDDTLRELTDLFESCRRRQDALRRLMATVPANRVERYRSMSYQEVARRAAGVEASLSAVAREHGGAATVTATEEDDWLKLRREMEDEGWASVGEMAFGRGDEWALRLAAHEASRGDPGREPGVVPSEAMECFGPFALLWNWCQRRLLRRPVAPLVEPMPKLRHERSELRRAADAVPRDALEWRLATRLTRLLNRHLPRRARVEVLPLASGHVVIARWGFWSWEIAPSSAPLRDEDGIIACVLAVQSFAARETGRSWPLAMDESRMRRARRADPDWATGCRSPKACLTADELRIWFGADHAPAFEFPPIRLAEA